MSEASKPLGERQADQVSRRTRAWSAILQVGWRALVIATVFLSRAFAVQMPAVLSDLNPGIGNSSPQSFVQFNGKIYFTANNGSQRHLYYYDSSLPLGSQVVKVSSFTVTTGSTTTYPTSLTPLNGKLLMVANGSANGPELWEYDPDAPAGSQFTEMAFDGTLTTTPPSRLYVHEGKLYFTASDGNRPSGHGSQLYVYDPALPKAAGTNPKRLTDINPSSAGGCSPGNLVGVPGKLLFSATFNYSDNAGGGISNPDNTELAMIDTTTYALTTFELAPGQATLKFNGLDYTDWYDSSPLQSRVVIGDTVYFSANIVESGTWRGNVLMKFQPSTMSAPVKVAELNPDSGVTITPDGMNFITSASYAPGDNISGMIQVGSRIYYSANYSANNGSKGQELFVCDIASGDAVSLAADINVGSGSSSPNSFYAWNGNLYFNADAGTGHGTELWEFNPISNTAAEVADIASGSAGSFPAGFIPYNGKLYFRAQSTTEGVEIFTFDPESRAVSLVLDLYPGANHGASGFNSVGPTSASYPNAIVTGRDLLFQGSDGSSGVELFNFPVPIANADNYIMPGDATLVVTNRGILTNDFPAAGLGLTPVLVTNVSHGALTLSTNGDFTYVPEIGFSGVDSFTYYTVDGVTNSGLATVSITVTPVVPQLYYITSTNGNAVTGDGLRKIGIDGSWPTIIVEADQITNATALAIDRIGNRAFIADSLPSGSQKIVTVSLTNGAISHFLDTPSLTVNDMKIDEVGGYLYFITATNGNAVPGDGLRRVKLDGTGLEILMDGNQITNALRMALDLANNRVFVYESFSGLQKIYAVDISSGAVSTFLDLRTITTSCLEVDAKNSHLYFTVATNGNAVIGDGLRRINLDGTGLTSIVEANQITNANSFALDLAHDRAYIGDSFAGRQRIYVVDLTNRTVTPFLETPNLTINGMVVPSEPYIPAPSIRSISVPAAGNYRFSQLNFTVNFSAPVVVEALDGWPGLPLMIGSKPVQASYIAGSGTTALQFAYVIQAGDLDTDGISLGNALQLNGSLLKGTNGLDAQVTFTPPDTSAILVDAVPPQVVSITRKTPAQQTVETNAVTFTVAFSEDVLGVNASSFVVTPIGNSTVIGSIGAISGGPKVYDVTVNLSSGRGEFRLDVKQLEIP